MAPRRTRPPGTPRSPLRCGYRRSCRGPRRWRHRTRRSGLGAMPDILELPPLDVPGLHRQALGGPFQGLDPRHLVDRDGLHTLPGGGGGGLIHRADLGALPIEIGIRLRGQPVTVAMRLEIGLFFKNRPTEPCEMLSTMPRCTAWRASSL